MKAFLSKSCTIFFYLPLLVFVLNGPALEAQDEIQKAEEYLKRMLDLKRFSGMVLVADGQRILMNRGFGMANFNNNIPFTPETKFSIAGLSEQFTAFIALRILKEKGISLHEPVKKYLGDLPFQKAGAITFHQLLSHTSGLADYPDITQLSGEQFFFKEDMIRYFENVTPDQAPGKTYSYSKLNYLLMGLILEKISRKPFEQLLAEYITSPLKMKNTSLDHSARLIKNKAQGFNYNFSDGWQNAPYLDPSNTFAALGVLSTTEDVLLWTQFVENEFNKNPEVREIIKSQTSQPGYGFQILLDAAGKTESIMGSGSYSSGFNADYLMDLKNDLIIIVLCNVRNPVAGMAAGVVRDIFLKRDYRLPLPRKTVYVDPEVLEEYAGEYTLEDQMSLKITTEQEKLYVDDGMHPKFEVFPQSENQFFVENADAEIEFIRIENGKVGALILRSDGFEYFRLPKIK